MNPMVRSKTIQPYAYVGFLLYAASKILRCEYGHLAINAKNKILLIMNVMVGLHR